MTRTSRLTAALASTALGVTLLLPTAASGTVTTVTGDLAGNIRSVGSTSFTVGVNHTSNSLRLLNTRWVKIGADAKTVFKRAGKTVKLAALRSNDAVTVRARCTFTITNASTKISCKASRVNATPANVATPVQFTVNATIAGILANAFTISAPQFDADERATVVVDALRAAQPISLAVDSSTSVFLGSTAAKFSVLSVGNKVSVAVTCMSAQPFNCRATRVDIALPKAEPVTMLGIVTLVTASSLTMDVESVVQRDDATVNVQVLKRKQMLVTIAAGTPVTIGGSASTLGSLVLGVRYTVTAHCRLEVPFGCAADAIKG